VKPSNRNLCLMLAALLWGCAGWGATISGTVKDPNSAPFKGAFVRARNLKTDVIFSALSDRQGMYRIEYLPDGEYDVVIRATGYKSDPRKNVSLTGNQTNPIDFALEKGLVRWSDLSNYEGARLLPEGKGKQILVGQCFACHGFQTREAPRRQEEAYWKRDVGIMMDRFGYFLRRGVDDAKAQQVIGYLSTVFGPDSELPRSPADLPQYKEIKYPASFSDDAMKITYVDFKVAGASRFPGAGRPDAEGNIWIWQYNGNRVAMLDPKTSVMREWQVPYTGQASIHSVVAAPDGTVWFSDQAQNKIGKLDPKTGKIVAYDAPPLRPDASGLERGSKHTLAIDLSGNVWSTGGPLAKFDPKTEKFTNYAEVPSVYGVAVDKENNVWFSEFAENGKIGKVDAKTGKITKYTPPTPNSYPRRMKLDSNGMVWFAEYRAGQIARFDPKTGTFKEFPLPGPTPTPYALGIDQRGHIWYSSMDLDIIGQLSPDTGAVVEYPFPYSENGMRDFFSDNEGRMWWGSQPNDRVGYFIPVAGNGVIPAAAAKPSRALEAPRAE
jgi:virginiamycin B lyase